MIDGITCVSEEALDGLYGGGGGGGGWSSIMPKSS